MPALTQAVAFSSNDVEVAFHAFPPNLRNALLSLRELIFDVASQDPDIGIVDETLKWSQPSYLVKHGSTIRLGTPKNQSGAYAMYFNCNSKLVDTYRELYSDRLSFEGNRAIIFTLGDAYPESAIRHCLSLALRYHTIKHQPLLGA